MSVDLRSLSPAYYSGTQRGYGFGSNTHAVRTPASINFDRIIKDTQVSHVNASVLTDMANQGMFRSGSTGMSPNYRSA